MYIWDVRVLDSTGSDVSNIACKFSKKVPGLTGRREQAELGHQEGVRNLAWVTANFRTSTKILDFGGLDTSIILISRGGIPRPIGNYPDSLSQGIDHNRPMPWRRWCYSMWVYVRLCTGNVGRCGAQRDVMCEDLGLCRFCEVSARVVILGGYICLARRLCSGPLGDESEYARRRTSTYVSISA